MQEYRDLKANAQISRIRLLILVSEYKITHSCIIGGIVHGTVDEHGKSHLSLSFVLEAP